MTILEEIFANKRVEVERDQALHPLAEVRAAAEAVGRPALNFIGALRCAAGQRPALIAEVKCASPSRGVLAVSFDPVALATIYQQNGASAISVLTDERYFKGSLAYLSQIGSLQPRLPLLRKDFILDPYQVYEARAAGADAMLLITACLDSGLLADLHALACDLGMAALVEVHSETEMETALKACRPALLGINNRNLHDFSISLDPTLRMVSLAPAGTCLVSESGIHTQADVDILMDAGVDAILVGEALVTAADTAAKVRSLAR